MLTNKNEAGTLLPQAFTFNASNQQVRTVLLNGVPYFCGKDVCVLDYPITMMLWLLSMMMKGGGRQYRPPREHSKW